MSRVTTGIPPLGPGDLAQQTRAGAAQVGAQVAEAGRTSAAVGRTATINAAEQRQVNQQQIKLKTEIEANYRRYVGDMIRIATETMQAGIQDYLQFRMWQEKMAGEALVM